MDLRDQDAAEPRILFEDGRLAAILKPPRMHSAPGLGGGGLCAWAFERFPEARLIGGGAGRGSRSPEEGGLLHRLDFETSGIVLFARDPEAFESLLRQQRAGTFIKEYIALCSASRELRPEGSLPPEGSPTGVDPGPWSEARRNLDAEGLSALLGAAPAAAIECSFRPFGPRGARVACLLPGSVPRGRAAPTYRSAILGCEPVARRPGVGGGEGALELRLSLSRGFRHQLRAQLAWIGLPILGDPLYGGLPDLRLRLYAEALSFAHPSTGEATRLSAG